MGTCVWCKRTGLFLIIDKNKLCQECKKEIYPDIKSKTSYLVNTYKRLNETKILTVKIELIDNLKNIIAELKKYEAKGIPTIDITIDLTNIFANVEKTGLSVRVIRADKTKEIELNNVIKEYGQKYGKLPEDWGLIESIDDRLKYFYDLMDKHKREGILTLEEIGKCMNMRESFRGITSRGIREDEDYKIYVKETLIYDRKNEYFDCEFKRYSMYSEIQHLIAINIFKTDLVTIRKNHKRRRGKSNKGGD